MPSELEQKLRHVAQQMEYPPTPTIEIMLYNPQRRTNYRFAWQLALLIVVIAASLLMWEPARAKVEEWLGLSSVEIVPPDQAPPANIELIEAVTLSKQSTLAEAQANTRFALKYPTELGLPDEVYLQTEPFQAGVIMVWRDTDNAIEYAFYQLPNSLGFYKGAEAVVVTEVDDSRIALWLNAPHTFWADSQQELVQQAYLIEQPVLIWEANGILYRLESNLNLEEAIAIANSLTEID